MSMVRWDLGVVSYNEDQVVRSLSLIDRLFATSGLFLF